MSYYELHTFVGHRTGVYGPLCQGHKDALVAEYGTEFEIDVLESDEVGCIKCAPAQADVGVEVLLALRSKREAQA